MSDGYGPPHLRPVDAGPATGLAPSSDPGTGLTPPARRGRGGARYISDVVVELGFLPRDRVEAAVEEGRASGRTPEQVLLESGALTGDQLSRAIAERFGFLHADLTIYKPDVAALNLISPQAARRFCAAPIGFDSDGVLLVAMADPSNVLALDDLKLMTGHEVRPVVASTEDIVGLIGRMSRLDEAVAAAVEQEEEEQGVASVTDIRESAEDAPTI